MFEHKGQTFAVVGERMHINRHGYPSPLFRLQAPCKHCGQPYETAVRQAKKPKLSGCRKSCFACVPYRPRARAAA
jgi:hypothetical protein